MSQTGVVKLFNTEKGFGFITGPDGSEIFCHIQGLNDGQYLQKGDTVTFDVEESKVKPGQMQAINVSGGSGGATGGASAGARPGGPPTGSIQGTCKSFNGSKGFGFIVGDGDNDIFFFIKDITDQCYPCPGDTLVFDCEESPKDAGKVVAKNITGGSGGLIDSKGKGKDGKDSGKDKGKGKGKGKDSGGWGGSGGWGDSGGWGGSGGWDDGWGKSSSKGGWDGGKGGKGGKGGPYGKDDQGGGDQPLTQREQQMLGMMMGMAMMIKKQQGKDGGGGEDPMAGVLAMMGKGGKGGGGGDPMQMIKQMMG